jgi:hypothetical protein
VGEKHLVPHCWLRWRQANINSGLPFIHLQVFKEEEKGRKTHAPCLIRRGVAMQGEGHKSMTPNSRSNPCRVYFCYLFLIWKPTRLRDAGFLFGCHTNHNSSHETTNVSRFLPHPLLCCQNLFILIIDVHLRAGEQISKNIVLSDPAPSEGA